MKLPSPGESISEVEIAQWLVEDGEFVEKDQSIAEIDSDKATLELPAEESGTIKIVVEEGVTAAVGDILSALAASGTLNAVFGRSQGTAPGTSLHSGETTKSLELKSDLIKVFIMYLF